MAECLKIMSLNVNGLGDYAKRKIMYKHFREQKADIVMLQETHNTVKNAKLWKCEWGGEWLNSYGKSNARGVSILFKPKLTNKVKISNVYRDTAGRILVVSITFEEQTSTLVNIYRENDDSVDTLCEIHNTLANRHDDHIIIGGDFNLVLNNELDARNRKLSHPTSHKVLAQMIDDFELTDIWRVKNPQKETFTWYRLNPSPVFLQARLLFNY